jgi:hypothetical protein
MAWGVSEIRGWLLQHPRPVTLKVVASDDRHHEVSVGGSWMAIAQSVHALSPTLIECHDEKGKIIRAVRPQDDENTGEAKQALPLQLPANVDPQSAQLIHFADLLAAAYRHSTDVAFERLASLFEAVNRRSESLERMIDKLVREKMREQLEAAPEPEPDQLSQMVQGFVAAAQQGAHTETNGSSNGKG